MGSALKAIVWMCVHDHYEPPDGQILFDTDGRLLVGLGPLSQSNETPEQTTLGAIRSDWGMDMAQPLPDETPAWLYDSIGKASDPAGLTFVIAEVYGYDNKIN